MMMRTHLAVGVFFALFLLPHVNSKLVFLSIVLISSLLPDIDLSSSKIGSEKLFRPLQWMVKHRGVIHSFSICLLIAILFAMFYPVIALPFFVGYASHLLIDSFTVDGIRPFWPLKSEISGRLRSGGRVEGAIFYTLLAVDVIFIIGFALKLFGG